MNSEGRSEVNKDTSETARAAHGEILKEREAELGELASQGKQDEFFREIIPLLKPLRSYIKRRLRIAYLTQQMRTPVLSSVDMLDDAVLEAYEKFNRKPKRLTLEQPGARERCSNFTLSKDSRKVLWRELLVCPRTRFHASRKRSKSIFGKRSRRIRNRRKEAKRPLDQERLSSYPFIT